MVIISSLRAQGTHSSHGHDFLFDTIRSVLLLNAVLREGTLDVKAGRRGGPSKLSRELLARAGTGGIGALGVGDTTLNVLVRDMATLNVPARAMVTLNALVRDMVTVTLNALVPVCGMATPNALATPAMALDLQALALTVPILLRLPQEKLA